MKKKAIYLLGAEKFDVIYGPGERAEIESLVDIIAEPQTKESIKENWDILQEVEVIFSGWGMATMDEEFLSHAPKLKAVFYGAGSIRGFMTEKVWERDIIVTSAYAANAIPVAEYCLATIIMGLKNVPYYGAKLMNGGPANWEKSSKYIHGVYGTTVGLVSLGMIGKHVLKLLKSFDVNILVYSQSMTKERAKEEGVESVSLEELFKRSHAVSIHTANLPETRGMITGKLIASMPQDATLINSSRGAVIEEEKMIEVLKKRPDLTAIIDVTNPEPPVAGSPLYSLPNVLLTPHIAGSMENECRRMGQYAINDCRNWLENKPMAYHIDKKTFERMA
jgi:phosphoglycerate dehydrogenase-like enzyme